MYGPKRLYKIEQGRKLCGVCGGVAEYLNLDPSLVRIIWGVACCTPLFGPGIALYVVAAFVLPNKSDVIGE